jgi:hypothetical protein
MQKEETCSEQLQQYSMPALIKNKFEEHNDSFPSQTPNQVN